MKKILVLQTWGIGDMIMATPMLSELRRRLPDARITLVAGSVMAAEVVDGSLVDEVRVMALSKMTRWKVVSAFIGLRRERFDAAILCARLSFRIAQLLRFLSGVRVVAGDCVGRRRIGYTHWVPFVPDCHRVQANMNILRTILPDAKLGPPSFHIDGTSHARADRIWAQMGMQGRVVLGVHPGSDPYEGKDKRPPPEILRLIIHSFLTKLPESRVLLVFGPLEQELVSLFQGIDKRVSFVRDEPIRVVGALISKICLLLGGDAALGHIAAARGIATVTLAGPTRVAATHPWSDGNVIIRTFESLPCLPCYDTPLYGCCPYGIRCMRGISVEVVVQEIVRRSAGAREPQDSLVVQLPKSNP